MAQISRSAGADPVIQFSVFADNKVGRFHELIQLFHGAGVHILALSMLDTTESSIMRIVVDYPKVARNLLEENHLSFALSEIIAVEVESPEQLVDVSAALTEAEINIHYIYAFLLRPHGKCGLAISLEDNEIAARVLNCRGLKILRQSDIAR